SVKNNSLLVKQADLFVCCHCKRRVEERSSVKPVASAEVARSASETVATSKATASAEATSSSETAAPAESSSSAEASVVLGHSQAAQDREDDQSHQEGLSGDHVDSGVCVKTECTSHEVGVSQRTPCLQVVTAVRFKDAETHSPPSFYNAAVQDVRMRWELQGRQEKPSEEAS
ncbi:unnamed protein product, partial [Ixodes pacificus]